MAAEGIEKAAKAADCFVKIETRGSGGAKNVLTDQEIADADCIIVAADTQVPMDRFDGKKVIVCQVSDGISKAGELVDRVISGDVPVYHAANGAEVQESKGGRSSGSIGHLDYTTLMKWCIPYASVRSRRWYSDCTGIFDRRTLRRYECIGKSR